MHKLLLAIHTDTVCTCLCNIYRVKFSMLTAIVDAETGGELHSHSYCMHRCISLNPGYHALSDR